MTILFYCSHCAQALNVPDEAAGQQVRCPFCQTVQIATTTTPQPPSQEFPGTPQSPQFPGPPMSPSTPSSYPGAAPRPAHNFEETGNPYQSPSEIDDDAYVEGDLVATKVRFGPLFDQVFALYKRHFGNMVLIGLIVVGINLFFLLIKNFANTIVQQADVSPLVVILVNVFGSVFKQLVQIWTALGMLRAVLAFARGENDTAFSRLFPDPVLTLKCFFVTFFQMLIATLPFLFTLPVLIPVWWSHIPLDAQENLTLPIVVTVALGIPAFLVYMYLLARVTVADCFLFDRHQGVFQSIGSSWRFTSGNGWVIVLGMLVAGLLTASGALACCVGIIMTVAMYPTFGVLLYLMITGQPSMYGRDAQYRGPVEQW